jgi:hypothetical protein
MRTLSGGERGEEAVTPARVAFDYAPVVRRSPVQWRRVARTVLRYTIVTLAIALPVSAAYVSYRWPWVWYGSREAYQRHRVLTFTMPPEHVVYEEDPARAVELLTLPPDPRTAYVGESLPRWAAPRRSEVPAGEYRTHEYQGRRAPHAEYVPRFHQWLFGPQSAPGLVFLHGRVGPSGSRRRVMVTLSREYGRSWLDPSNPNVRVGLELTTWSSVANEAFRVLRGNNKRHFRIPLGPTEVMRLHAGQPDPRDEGRFAIKYEIDGVPGTIEGRVGADDRVTLRVLDGPATVRPVTH